MISQCYVHRFVRAALGTAVALATSATWAFEACGELANAYGPFDYRVATRESKSLVEKHHFTLEVESLERGNTSAWPGADLDYTLRVFPNHSRALFAMIRLGQKERTEKPKGSQYTVACWLDRAVRFAPEDGAVRVLYGVYLTRKGAQSSAREQLAAAEGLIGNDANLSYNIGLAYFDLGEFDKSREYARRAYEGGFPLQGLKQKLERAGKW